MKLTILFAVLLGVFLAPALASYNINVDNNNNADGGQQSVSVNNEHKVATVDNNGLNPWNAIWDYETGFAAVRHFAKKLCIVHELNKDAVPSIHALDTLVKEKKLQGKGPGGPPPKSLIYSVNPDQVHDLSKFGRYIINMCRNVPTYKAEETEGASLFFSSENCFRADIVWILNISFCKLTVEN